MTALLQVAWIFLRVGVIFVGGGYVLVPLLHRVMVDHYRWLSMREFVDGVALSQLTPGPLAMLATFAGFRAGGFAGAAVGTFCIFLPCTAFMLFVSSRYDRLRNVSFIRGAMDGVIPAVVGLVAASAVTLGRTSLSSSRDYLFLAASFLLLFFTRVSPMVVILGAGVAGYFLHFT